MTMSNPLILDCYTFGSLRFELAQPATQSYTHTHTHREARAHRNERP